MSHPKLHLTTGICSAALWPAANAEAALHIPVARCAQLPGESLQTGRAEKGKYAIRF